MNEKMWLEVQVLAHRLDAEAVAAALEPHASGGVVVEEPVTYPAGQEGHAIDPDASVVVKAYLSEADAKQWPALRRRLHRLRLSEPLRIRSRELIEEDWAYSWREFFPVLHVGRRLVVQPSWREYEPQGGEVVLHLDPGLAFGTGQHPTTRLCLETLEELVRPGALVLDVGTGSGILAIAAAKLGATMVIALDIDSQAVRSARENAQLNGVADVIRVEQGSVGGGWPGQLPKSEFDLTVANISALAICDLAVKLVDTLKSSGALIASGFIIENAEAVAQALTQAGLGVERALAEDDWHAIVARKP